MTVKRIVANIATHDIGLVKAFYVDILGLEAVMDHGWILTLAGPGSAALQISFPTKGGSWHARAHLSIEVDNLEEIYRRMVAAGMPVEYGPTNEPWAVRRLLFVARLVVLSTL